MCSTTLPENGAATINMGVPRLAAEGEAARLGEGTLDWHPHK